MDGGRAPLSVCTACWLTSILSLSDTQKRSWDGLVQVVQGRPESLVQAGGCVPVQGQLVAGWCLLTDPWRWTPWRQSREGQQDFSLCGFFQFSTISL